MRIVLHTIDNMSIIVYDELVEYFEPNEYESDETFIKFKDGSSKVVREDMEHICLALRCWEEAHGSSTNS